MKNKLKHHIKNILSIIYLLFMLFWAIVALIVGGATLIAGALNIPLWVGAIIYIILLILMAPTFNLITKN